MVRRVSCVSAAMRPIPAEAPTQLKERLDVEVGLAGAGLHLDVEVELGRLAGHQLLGDGQIRAALHALDVGQQRRLVQSDRVVAEAGVAQQRALR
ncbi:hypothetical protein CKO31_20000 [Thiohalocapsa halophila]|uniref:Uncharacterized protein n=1 Tax=Thiohalocapsa halophila TaxID=69359 RepID=A0ABS1CM22_9GAMM|nr:hypothetical protein [Thiohalocapsa halophila]MBK1632992.1 hypothetical protein [Thiohalocapsa halophila]